MFLGSVVAVGDAPPEPYLCLVPIDEVEIDDDWQVMGLAGTGSKTLVADGVFVPRHRMIPLRLSSGGWEARGKPDVPPLYRLPHVTTIPFHFCATALGTAEGLLEDVIAEIGERHSFGAPVAEYATMQLRVAAASAEIDCARMLIERDTREAMAAMREGRSLTLGERARNPARHGHRGPVLPARRGGAVRGGRRQERLFDQCPAQVPRRPGGGESHHSQMGRGGYDLWPRRLGLDPASPFI